MEPESSSPYPQVPATRPYPEPTQSNPNDPSNFLKIHLNIILPNTSWSPQWPLSLRLPHQQPVHNSILPHTRHMPCPSHSSRFYHPHNIGKRVQIIQFLVMQLSPFPCHLVPLRSKKYEYFTNQKGNVMKYTTFCRGIN